MSSEFANFVRVSQKALKYSDKEFAKRLGVSRSTVSRWKNDKATPAQRTQIEIVQLVDAMMYVRYDENGDLRVVS